MFQTSELEKLDASYFNIILTGDYDGAATRCCK